MADVSTYSDIQITEGDQVLSYSTSGLKAKRVFKFDGLDMANPDATMTIYNLWQSGKRGPKTPDSQTFPFRGCPHPTIVWPDPVTHWAQIMGLASAFCADTLTVTAITSTQAMAEVGYSVLNAMTQEPSISFNAAPAHVIISSSVHNIATEVDVAGQPLTVPYLAQGSEGAYKIYQGVKIDFTETTYGPFTPGTPSRKFTGQVQVPTTLVRFVRRETQPRDPTPFVGYVNSTTWQLLPAPGIVMPRVMPRRTCLCTRIESDTHDEGVSYLVTYEFQCRGLKSSPSSYFVAPALADEDDPSSCSPWYIGSYYVLASGYGLDENNKAKVQAGQVPPDASPYVFSIYGEIDFESILALTQFE